VDSSLHRRVRIQEFGNETREGAEILQRKSIFKGLH
jgi:hypothetical protein